MVSEGESVLGIIGVGHLAQYLIDGLRRAGDRRPILVSPRSHDRARALAASVPGLAIGADNQAVVDGAGMVVVAVLPDQVIDCVRALRWRRGQILVSVAIDVPLAALTAAAPGATCCRTMPVDAQEIGRGGVPLYPELAPARALLEKLGPVYAVEDEKAFDSAASLAAFYLWLFGLMDAVAQAAVANGLPREAACGLAAAHFEGAGAMARARGDTNLRALLDHYAAGPTITGQGLKIIEGAQAFAPWGQALASVFNRLRAAATG